MGAFADALDSVPMALAENSGLNPIETLGSIKSRQVKERNSRLGVDCMQTGSNGESPSPVPISLYSTLEGVKHTTHALSCRYAEELCLRPSDRQETAVAAGNAIVSDGAQGKRKSIRDAPLGKY